MPVGRYDNRLPLTLASGIYDITRPLINGLVDVEGIRLNVLSDFPNVDNMFRRMLKLEFDAAELSVAHYLACRERGIPMIAIPVFLNRLFPHSFFYRNTASTAKTPADLVGKRIGLPQYQVTRAMWLRGVLADQYGLQRTDVTWVTDFAEKMEIEPAPGIKTELDRSGRDVNQLLADGVVEAAMSWSRPTAPNTAGFFADLKGEEMRYFQQFGIFPMMHTVAVKQEILDQHPWVARCLVDAYTASKRMWYQWRDFTRGGSMPFARYALAEQAKILGDDPFPFELAPNVKTLETVARYALEDRLITKPIADVTALWVQDVALDERVRQASSAV